MAWSIRRSINMIWFDFSLMFRWSCSLWNVRMWKSKCSHDRSNVWSLIQNFYTLSVWIRSNWFIMNSTLFHTNTHILWYHWGMPIVWCGIAAAPAAAVDCCFWLRYRIGRCSDPTDGHNKQIDFDRKIATHKKKRSKTENVIKWNKNIV